MSGKGRALRKRDKGETFEILVDYEADKQKISCSFADAKGNRTSWDANGKPPTIRGQR